MRALVHDQYGSFDELELRDVPVPALTADGILVRVQAAALHVGDCFGVRGAPLLMRVVTGLFKPKQGVPGFDFAGVIVAVGENVAGFRPGDEVFGECQGSCAEYVLADPGRITSKPSTLAFEEAAALTTSGLAALHALRDVAKIEPGREILINGASGGVGHFAVQIAKNMGAHVTGVCSTKNVEMVRSLGADEVVDYTKGDFTLDGPRYDLVFDNVENRSLKDIRRALKSDGMLLLNSGTGAKGLRLIWRLFQPLLLSPFAKQDLRRYLSEPKREDLDVLAEMAESGRLRAVIDRQVNLGEVPDALASIEEGHTRGKVVVNIRSDGAD